MNLNVYHLIGACYVIFWTGLAAGDTKFTQDRPWMPVVIFLIFAIAFGLGLLA